MVPRRAKLPEEIEQLYPEDIINHIYSYIPYPKKQSSPNSSPSLQKELKKIQTIKLNKKSEMYMRDLEDFLLD
jgi:hypothetical protein